MSRAQTLAETGHPVTKIEIIIEGGTFGSYDKTYSVWFVTQLYYAANVLGSSMPHRLCDTLDAEIKTNESAACRIIGLTVETRPDWIDKNEILRFRRLGVTRVQIGIQHLNDEILRGVNRGCTTAHTIKAIELLLYNGFKVDGHFMLDLPGSDLPQDRSLFVWVFSPDNVTIRVDQYKLYPTMVLSFTKILEWYNAGTYKPYAESDPEGFKELMIWILTHIPEEIRVNRVIRDFNKSDIYGGTTNVSMRDDLSREIKARGLVETDIRFREIKQNRIDVPGIHFRVKKFRSSEGWEFFISANTKENELCGFVRLRLSEYPTDGSRVFFTALLDAALIRELHVYGNLVPQNCDSTLIKRRAQHIGIGKALLHLAECIAIANRYEKVAIIAGVGVREYYAKVGGYYEEDTYMVRNLTVPLECPELWHPARDAFMTTYGTDYVVF